MTWHVCSGVGVATSESEVIERKGLRGAVRANQAIWQGRGGGASRKKSCDNYNEQCLFHFKVVLRFIPFSKGGYALNFDRFTRVPWSHATFFF